MATFFITELKDNIDISVSHMNKYEFNRIVDVLLPLIEIELGQDEAQARLGVAQGLEQFDMTDFSISIFKQAYELIINVCEEYDQLKPYAQEFKEKLQEDPRYTSKP